MEQKIFFLTKGFFYELCFDISAMSVLAPEIWRFGIGLDWIFGLEESLKGLPEILGHTEDSLWILEPETRGLAEISN